jgi:hypothetical protein
MVNLAISYNKPVIIRVGTGGDFATGTSGSTVCSSSTTGHKPCWLKDELLASSDVDDNGLVQVNDGGITKSIPRYWSPMLLQKKKQMYAALAAHYKGRQWNLNDGTPAIKHIQLGIANQDTEDWTIDDTKTGTTNWRSAGWTEDKIRNAYKELYQSVAVSWPEQTLGAAVNPSGSCIDPTYAAQCGATTAGPCPSTCDKNHLAKLVIADLRAIWPLPNTRFIPQKNNLNAKQGTTFPTSTGTFDILYNNQPCAAQDAWNCFVDSDPANDTQAGCISTCSTYRYNGRKSTYPNDMRHRLFYQASQSLGAIGAVFSETYAADVLAAWTTTNDTDGFNAGQDENQLRQQLLKTNSPAATP